MSKFDKVADTSVVMGLNTACDNMLGLLTVLISQVLLIEKLCKSHNLDFKSPQIS